MLKKTIATLALLALTVPASADVTADCETVTVTGPGVFFVQIGDGGIGVRLDVGESESLWGEGNHWAVWSAVDVGADRFLSTQATKVDLLASGVFCEDAPAGDVIPAPRAVERPVPTPPPPPVPLSPAGVFPL